jgi:hypothetical protein
MEFPDRLAATDEAAEFNIDEWTREVAMAMARKIDEEILKCLTDLAMTSGTATNSPSSVLKLGDVREMIKGSELLLTPSRVTCVPLASGTRSAFTFGLAVRKSDPASAVLQLPSA